MVFAVVGAFEGAARQLAQLVALGLGYLCARPLGKALGPTVAQSFQVPIIFGAMPPLSGFTPCCSNPATQILPNKAEYQSQPKIQ